MQTTILTLMKMTKFSKQVENTVGKGEIARYEQFLLFLLCFQNTFTADSQKPGLDRERVKLLLSDQLRDHQKAVTVEIVSPNATKVHYTKQSNSIHYTLTCYF